MTHDFLKYVNQLLFFIMTKLFSTIKKNQIQFIQIGMSRQQQASLEID